MASIHQIAVLILCLATLQAQAQSLSYEKAMPLGLKNSPIVSEQKAYRLEKIGPALDETALLNPELEYEYNLDSREHEITLSQPLRLSDISLQRYAYKNLLKEINTYQKKLDLLQTYQQLATKYYNLYTLQEQKKYIEEHLDFLNKVSNTVHHSINHNNLSTAEIYAFDADILSTRTELSLIKEELETNKTDFAQIFGLANSHIYLQQPPTIKLSASYEQILNTAQTNPSLQKMLTLKTQEAENNVALVRQDRYMPVIVPKVVYNYDNMEDSDSWKLGLSLSVPLWNRQNGAYGALKAKEHAARKELQALNAVSFPEVVKKAYQNLAAQSKALEQYTQHILPDYRQSVKKMEASFNAGQFNIFDVWQIREKYLAAQEKYLALLNNTLTTKHTLEILIGTRLEDIR